MTVVLGGWAVARAVPLDTVAQGQQELNVVFQYNKITTQSSISVWDKERTQLVGHSCSASLVSGAFLDYPISFEVDQDGAGTITIGSANHIIHEKPSIAGGISCNRMHSLDESLVACTVTAPEAMQFTHLNKKAPATCFLDSHHQLGNVLEGLLSRPPGSMMNSSHQPAVATGSDVHLDANRQTKKRQGACGVWSKTTHIVGNGDPHQNPMNVQLSVRLQQESPPTYHLTTGEERSCANGSR